MALAKKKININNGVDENLVKNKKETVNKIIDEVDIDDDDDDINQYKNNFNNQNYLFENRNIHAKAYLPQYNENEDKNNFDINNFNNNKNNNNNNFNNLNNDDDIIMKNEEEDKNLNNNKIIERIKIENKNDNNLINLNREITPIKRKENIERIHTEIKKKNLIETPNLRNENKFQNLTSNSKLNNINNNNLSSSSYLLSSGVQLRNTNSKKLPTEKDESVLMYWYDAIEENINRKHIIIFFGKIFDPSINNFTSISLVIKNIDRTIFVMPKENFDSKDKINEVYLEFEKMRKNNFSFIKEYKTKIEEKKYCFELPINRDINHTLLKIKYKSDFGKIPNNLNSNTFDYIFGKDSSLLENIILNRKIYGPCWLKIKNFEYGKSLNYTLSNFEILIDDYKNIEVLSDEIQKSKIIPPFKILSLSTKNIQINNQNELFCISCVLIDNFHIEDEKGYNDINKFQPLIFFRKIDNTLPIYKDRLTFPFNSIGIKEIDTKLFGENNIFNAGNETALISQFLNKIYQFDPDIIIGHNLYNNHLENILSRINKLKIQNWSRISRFKREVLPKFLQNINLSNEYIRTCLTGRLICDTFSSIREILLKETSYDLDYLCEKYLKKKIPEIDISQILSSFSKISEIEKILQITLDEAFFSLVLMNKFQILPLTKQLTSISGNLWIKSLQSSRANRCEFLLLHKFYEKNYLYPDKENRFLNDEKYINFDSSDDEDYYYKNKNLRNKKNKPQYSGGLVLQPQPGLYDKIILVMDFNSLYPSIIQEYNISFETVIRPSTQSFYFEKNKKNEKNKNNKNNKNNNIDESIKNNNYDNNNENDDEEIDIDNKIKKMQKSILPLILEKLVSDRNIIKKLQKKEKDPFKNSLLEIKQKALKVSANSLYGFLGYKNSRFYCKEIASLVTSTGRKILKNAASIVEKNNYKIIYGDTDSVIINTMTKNIFKSIEIGNFLKKIISQQYKLLIMDIDGLFKSLLLLKKKKYAGLKFIEPYNENSKVEIEMKGIDIVRRDWSQISKDVGNNILNCILSGNQKEEIISNIFEELKKISLLLDQKKIPLKDFIITKQLTKNIDDYNDLKALPHVRVAKRLKEKGDMTIKVNSYIPYIVCLPKDSNNDNYRNTKSIAERSYHPKEIEEDNNLQVDILWYKENQILSIVKRLISHIQEISISQLCECLGIENKHYNINDNNYFNNQIEEIYNFKLKEGLNIKCNECNKNYFVKDMITRNDCINKIMKCPFCNNFIKKENKISNLILHQIKRDIFLYYRRKQICRKCKESSSTFFIREKCPDQSCKGIMINEYNEFDIANEINFLFKLTNVEENIKSKYPVFEKGVEKVKNIVNEIYDKMAYNSIDMNELFGFLNI